MPQPEVNPSVSIPSKPITSTPVPAPSTSRIHQRGFASMDPVKQREIASMGGKAVNPARRSFSKDRKLAQTAGRKGGSSIRPEKRSFFQDRDLARQAGRKGGLCVPAGKRSFSVNPALAKKAGRKGGRS